MEQIEIKSEFKKKKTRQFLIAIPLLPAIIVIVLTSKLGTELLNGISNLHLLIVAFVIVIIGLVFSLLNWRCPNCNSYLGKRINPKFCANCGVELR